MHGTGIAPGKTTAAVSARHVQISDFRLADGTAVDLRLAYTRCGPQDAPAYLILHGYAGSHHALALHPDAPDAGWAMAWAGPGRAVDTLRNQVLTVNLPGSAFGSRWEGAPHTYASVSGMARAIAGLLDHLGVPCLAGAIGYSFGGYVAQQLKADHPERAGRVLALCTSHRGRGSADELAFLRGLTDAASRADFRRSVLLRAGVREWAEDHGEAALQQEWQAVDQWARQFDAAALWRLRAAALGFALERSPAGTTLLYASSDALFPPPDPLPACAATVNTRYGHQALLLDPAPWAQPIRDWIQRGIE